LLKNYRANQNVIQILFIITPMKLDQLVSFFEHDPSAKLLRATHAPFVIHFLHQHFKTQGNLATPHSILQHQLSLYLDTLHQTWPETMCDRADVYLTTWSTGNTRWLRRYFNSENDESLFQLTPQAEDVLKFLETVLNRSLGFVGTESRLNRIIETLSDIVIRSSADPTRRLEHLRAERARIDAEMESIEGGAAVSTHSPTAIRERFADVVSDLISLQGDFRAVEESFKNITREVQTQQTAQAESRGSILGAALDAENRLKEEDQGASFDAFVKLILSQSRQDELESLIRSLDEIIELQQQQDGKLRIRNMVGNLTAEAEKVLDTTRRLSAVLRRLLDSRTSSMRQRLATVLREIQSAATGQAESPSGIGLDVFTDLELSNVYQRTFWEAPLEFESVWLANDEQSVADQQRAFMQLAAMQRLDWDSMRQNISSAIRNGRRTTLGELIEEFPPSAGSIELLGYIQLAHDDGHEVDEHQTETVSIVVDKTSGEVQSFEIPQVVFSAVLDDSIANRKRSGKVLPR